MKAIEKFYLFMQSFSMCSVDVFASILKNGKMTYLHHLIHNLSTTCPNTTNL